MLLETWILIELKSPRSKYGTRAFQFIPNTLSHNTESTHGIAALPAGRRKTALASTLDGLLELFGSRVLSFDAAAARCYAQLATQARAAGKGFPTPDGYIAAIAASKGFVVATRDTSAFDAAGVEVIDPWKAGR